MQKTEIIKNPLTLIAIFAGLSDLAMTAVLPLLPTETQEIFVWFVMGYPLLLVCGFFYILIWKREALYAPSDFKDDATWLKVFKEKEREILSKYPVERDIVSTREINDASSQAKKDGKNIETNNFYKFLKSIGMTHTDIKTISSEVDNVDNLPDIALKKLQKKETAEMIRKILDEFPDSRNDFHKLKLILKDGEQ